MTITDPTDTVADGDPVELEPQLCWLNLADWGTARPDAIRSWR